MKFAGSVFIRTGFLLLAVLSLCWCIHRDTQIEKQYPGDLPSRVVGCRLQTDGMSPYFYHWRTADALRCCNWNNTAEGMQFSNITATPFYLFPKRRSTDEYILFVSFPGIFLTRKTAISP